MFWELVFVLRVLCCVTSDGHVENLDVVKAADEAIVVLTCERQFTFRENTASAFAL